ncbi:hypothetical protein IT575_05215 [bacterium]|nr:hypothetical protein [bacterium]
MPSQPSRRHSPPRIPGSLGAAAAMAVLAVWLCQACGNPPLPDGAWLASEDLGLGITLLSDQSAARSASGPANVRTRLEFSTPEALLNRKPYEERPDNKDLVICVYSEEVPAPDEKDVPPAGAIFELKCYLAPPELSALTLKGQKLADLDPDEMVALLGEPFTPMQASPDGQWHLSWYFAAEKKPGRAYRVTSSHAIDGHCFALELAECEAPK